MLKFITASVATLLLLGSSATASSDKAWDALFAKVNGTCIGQSGLNTPEASAPVVFDDSVGKIALLLRGETGSGKKRTEVQMICLYDKKSGQASISDYRWLGR